MQQQEALAYNFQPWPPSYTLLGNGGIPDNQVLLKKAESIELLQEMASENPVIVFGRRGCCMSHVVKLLLLGLGVNPPVCELDEEADQVRFIDQLCAAAGGDAESSDAVAFPVVFIGGKFFGGLERVMASHISGDLVPVLKKAGALWL